MVIKFHNWSLPCELQYDRRMSSRKFFWGKRCSVHRCFMHARTVCFTLWGNIVACGITMRPWCGHDTAVAQRQHVRRSLRDIIYRIERLSRIVGYGGTCRLVGECLRWCGNWAHFLAVRLTAWRPQWAPSSLPLVAWRAIRWTWKLVARISAQVRECCVS